MESTIDHCEKCFHLCKECFPLLFEEIHETSEVPFDWYINSFNNSFDIHPTE
jgi:hypothetical protein